MIMIRQALRNHCMTESPEKNIQFYWSMLSEEIEEEKYSEALLEEIINLSLQLLTSKMLANTSFDLGLKRI